MIRSALGFMLALSSSGSVGAVEPPDLRIESPEELVRFARRLEEPDRSGLAAAMRLTGLSVPGPPIRVLLAPEGSEAARRVPSWVVAYARGDAGAVVLIPTRTPSYPDGSLKSVLCHEITHVLIARAAGGRPVPRWFDEGLAMTAARSWDVEDRMRLILELLPGRKIRLKELDALFDEGFGRASRAYTLSGAFVSDLIEREGPDVSAAILGFVARGEPFEQAFYRASGMTLGAAEVAFWKRQNLWNRWVPVLTSSLTLWVGITLLALYATKKRRSRDTRIKQLWEREEAPPDEDPEGPFLN